MVGGVRTTGGPSSVASAIAPGRKVSPPVVRCRVDDVAALPSTPSIESSSASRLIALR
jgi:hypothetical protein